jgi:hypothetical protein
MKPIRWELGSYMAANSKWLPGAFFMVWGVALAIIFVRELCAEGWRLLRKHLLPVKVVELERLRRDQMLQDPRVRAALIGKMPRPAPSAARDHPPSDE